jgi:hypothetical protein
MKLSASLALVLAVAFSHGQLSISSSNRMVRASSQAFSVEQGLITNADSRVTELLGPFTANVGATSVSGSNFAFPVASQTSIISPSLLQVQLSVDANANASGSETEFVNSSASASSSTTFRVRTPVPIVLSGPLGAFDSGNSFLALYEDGVMIYAADEFTFFAGFFYTLVPDRVYRFEVAGGASAFADEWWTFDAGSANADVKLQTNTLVPTVYRVVQGTQQQGSEFAAHLENDFDVLEVLPGERSRRASISFWSKPLAEAEVFALSLKLSVTAPNVRFSVEAFNLRSGRWELLGRDVAPVWSDWVQFELPGKASWYVNPRNGAVNTRVNFGSSVLDPTWLAQIDAHHLRYK